MGKRTDLKIWTVAVDPGACLRVRCTHPIRIPRNRHGNGVRGSAFCSASFRAADYDHHKCQALTHWRRFDFATTRISHRPQPESSRVNPPPSYPPSIGSLSIIRGERLILGGGGGCHSHAICATHPHPPTYKMDPKWHITQCYICTPEWRHTCRI